MMVSKMNSWFNKAIRNPIPMAITDDYDYAKDVWLIKCVECGVSMTREAYAYGHDCEVA
jgi:hypothetical protein